MKIDKYIEVYLDAFDEFCDKVRERYDAELIEDISSEAMISLYRGFLIALPAIEKAKEKAHVRRVTIPKLKREVGAVL